MKGVGKFGEVMADEKGPADFGASLDKLRRVVRSGSQTKAILDFVMKELRRTFPHYSWVGVYLVEGDELVLRAWSGAHATQHVRIPIGGSAFEAFGWVNRAVAATGLVILIVGIVLLILSMRLGSAASEEDYDVGIPRKS